MTSHLSRSGLPLPGVRELFPGLCSSVTLPRLPTYIPDLFHPRPMATPQTSPTLATHDSQQRTSYDVSSTSLFLFICLFSNCSQVMNLPSVSALPNFQLPPSDRSTAQGTAIGTTDHQHTHARFNHPPYPHVQPSIHITRRWPYPDVVSSMSASHMSPRSVSPEVPYPYSQPHQQVGHDVGPSSLPDREKTCSPTMSSPHMAHHSIESAPQPHFDQKSVETHPGKKRHKCDVCGSYWGRPSSLKIHMVSHTGVKGASQSIFPVCNRADVNCSEFVCSICKQDFGVKSNYTRHIRVHHKDSSEGTQIRAAGRRRRGSRRNQDVGPVRFVDEGPKFQGQ